MKPYEGATPFHASLGVALNVDEDNGAVIAEMDIRDDLRGPVGSLEGGVVATLLDIAGASAAARAMGAMVATADMTVKFLAPGRVGPVRATDVCRGLKLDKSTLSRDLDRLLARGLVRATPAEGRGRTPTASAT